MSEYPLTTEGRPLGKERSPWAVLGLALITIGIYFLVWYYKINREMRDHDERIQVKPGLAILSLFVPIVSLVSMFNTAKRLQQIQAMEGLETSCSPGLALILAIFTGGIGYPAYMASILRRHWQIHQQAFAGAGYTPYGALAQPGQPGGPQGLGGPSGYAQLPASYSPQAQAPGEQLSPDGRYRWDGQAWQPVHQPQQAQAEVAAHGEQLSADGRYRWDGQAWQPVQQPLPQAQPQAAGVTAAQQATGEQLSPDGRYRWDGQAWQPVHQTEAAAAAPAEQLSPDGRHRWDGQAWQPVASPPQQQAEAHPSAQPQGLQAFPPQPAVQAQPAQSEPEVHTSPADAGGQLSPDGRYRWDGHNWQPVGQ